MTQHFKKGSLPSDDFKSYEKTRATPALRIDGTICL